MQKDLKIMLGAIAATVLLIVGFSLWQGGKKGEEVLTAGPIAGVEAVPEFYDLGAVPINGGIVTKEYEVENTSGGVLKLKKITTSCMCTQAKVSVGDRETRFFGMEHGMDRNPPVNIEVGLGETAKVTVNFDPAAHGPEGVGPFDRVVWLAFSDPAGVKELKFSGVVVK